MPQENAKTRDRNLTKEPKKYIVIFHNDDFTPMDFVTTVLIHIFFKSESEAENLMLKVHNEGKAKVGEYSYDIAASKVSQATEAARHYGFPLRITMQPA